MDNSSDYPDLSKPLNHDEDYPDLSKPIEQGQDNSKGFSFDKLLQHYQNFMQPKNVDKAGHLMVDTFLGRMPDVREPEHRHEILKSYSQSDMNKTAGIMTMALAPEVRLASLMPAMIRSRLPQLSGGAKIAADYLANIGKVGASGFAGSKMMGMDNEQAATAGGVGAGIAAGVTPLTMMTASMNPLVRLGAGSLLGLGASQLFGAGPYTSGASSIAGGLLGLRGGGAAQIAARDVAAGLTPEQRQLAQTRQAAGNNVGVPLNLAEASRSPVVEGMLNNAAASSGGNKALYPFAAQREVQEENAYKNFLNTVSPQNAEETIEPLAFRQAFKKAEEQGVKINVDPVVKYIDEKLPKFEEGSKIAGALRQAKERLNLTPETSQRYQQQMAPIVQIEDHLQQNVKQLRAQLSAEKSNAPEPYFRASTGYDQKISSLENDLAYNEKMLNEIQQQKQSFLQQSGVSPYENTLEGLHNAKLGIRGIIEGQGDKAIGRTAAGQLKKVNKLLNEQLKNSSPEYAQANQISNMRQARQEIEKVMATSKLTGSNFYDRVLNNRQQYDALFKRLGDPNNKKIITPAQQQLRDMHTAFPDLMDNLYSKSGKSLAQGHPDVMGGYSQLAKSFLNKIYMDRYNKAVIELMINPNWQSELKSVARMQAGEDRGIRLGRLISKVATAGSAGAYQNQQGSQPNGLGS